MADPSFINPIENPLFEPVMHRTLALYIAGFFLILGLNKFKLKDLWKKNIGQRYISWLIIGPIYLTFVLIGGYGALFLLGLILFIAIFEVKKVSSLPKPYINGLLFLSLLSIYISSFHPQFFYSLPLIYFLVLTFIAIRENSAEKSFINAAIAMFVSIWIIFSLTHFVLLGHFNNTLDNTKSLLILLGFAIPLSDIFAYVIGRSFSKIKCINKWKVASNLSSKKSYAGSLGNIVGAGIGIAIMYFSIKNYLPIKDWIIIAILLGVGGLVGDITASMFKRFYNVKDSSNLIPGHGGILDRIDSTLRGIVILYYYLLFFM